MIHTLKLKYDPADALEYYDILKRDFQHLHWEYEKHHNDPGVIDPKNVINELNGWGLQTVYNDPTFPYHSDLDPHDEDPEYYKDTPMVFGFFERLKNILKDPFRSFLMSSPGGHYIRWCHSHNPPHGMLFVPIITNGQAYFRSKANEEERVYVDVGNVYLVDPIKYPFAFNNDGDTPVASIQVGVPEYTFDYLLNLEGKI